MAGHSQFKNIMHKKGKQDAIRSKLFSKLAREITVAAKMGLPDPAMNARLRAAVIEARGENMPKDNIERAIKKASGADAENYDEVRYEGYAPGGVAVIVEALDRQPQSHRRRDPLLLHQGRRRAGRDRRGVLHVRPRRPYRVRQEGGHRGPDDGGSDRRRCRRRRHGRRESHEVTTSLEGLREVAQTLEGRFGEPRQAKLVWKPQNTVPVDDEAAEKILKLVDTLEENDDVQTVYANFELSEALIAKLSA